MVSQRTINDIVKKTGENDCKWLDDGVKKELVTANLVNSVATPTHMRNTCGWPLHSCTDEGEKQDHYCRVPTSPRVAVGTGNVEV